MNGEEVMEVNLFRSPFPDQQSESEKPIRGER